MRREDIQRKIEDRAFFTPEEGLDLYHTLDFHELGRLAREVRLSRHGRKTYYVRNRHIDYSNLCVFSCNFCAFERKPHQTEAEGMFDRGIGEILDKVREGLKDNITELHIVGGMHPTHPFEFYTDMLREIKKLAPHLHLKCFTAGEIDYFSKRFKKSVPDILSALIDAGLDSLPGGGAEILVPEVRKEICGPKGGPERWLDVHRIAHRLGLKSTATMLYGHVEKPIDWFDHMARVRDLQEETGGFLAFIPLAFNPKGTIYESVGYTSAYKDLKLIALSRLFLPNVDHIKGYWVMSGVGVAELTQDFGADDLHGTVMEENITAMAGGRAPQGLTVSDLCEMVRESGYEPVERDSLYRAI